MSLLARVVNRFILVAKRKPSSAITLILTFGTVSFVFYRDIEPNRPVKTILVWNAPERAEIVAFVRSPQEDPFSTCPVTECRIDLASRAVQLPLESYDAIVINFNDQFKLTEDFPRSYPRPARQRLIFFTQEPPPALKEYNFTQYANFFNWTMTYRMDSDIQLSYGRFRPRTELTTPSVKGRGRRTAVPAATTVPQMSSNKTKLVAWMATQCETDGRRENYIKQLKRYIDVDVYGLCGNLKCARHPVHVSHPRCYDMLESTYKFYLSFENSICRDYVTEKFFNIAQRRIVPVVYGGADYASMAPVGSFIDTRLYDPYQLAAYLKRLDANDTLYQEFFGWKNDYDVDAGVVSMAKRGFCDLCRRLHYDETFKSYGDLASLWKHPSHQCQSPHFSDVV